MLVSEFLIGVLLALITVEDCRHKIIRNRLVGAVFICSTYTYWIKGIQPLAVLESVLIVAVILTVIISTTRSMGGGDVKLLLVVAYCLGSWAKSLMCLELAFITGALAGSLYCCYKWKTGVHNLRLPFAPYITAGTVMSYYYYTEIWDWWTTGCIKLIG